MRILHVSMGLPPFRTGGLNRYCADLMATQKEQGEDVELLYPGEFILSNKTMIRKTQHEQFELFRIVNPLPLALTNGIAEPKRYMRPCKTPEVYVDFLKKNKPDVIHVHTFQGIHKEFFKAAHDLKIRMVFTTHDYYPFCSNCTLLQKNGKLCSGAEGEKCARCNLGRGLSPVKEVVMQSRLYERMKYSCLVKKIRSKQVKAENTAIDELENSNRIGYVHNAKDYEQLKEFYLQILGYMDCIHCNSQVAMDIYTQYVTKQKCEIVGITHAGITCTKHKQDEKKLRIGYVGGLKQSKGLYLLLEAIAQLEADGKVQYELWLFGADYAKYAAQNRHIHNGGIYTKETEEKVWDSFDVLVVPSQWYETYGFVVVEALAHGVNVICSDLVGAKQLLAPNDIFCHDSAEELVQALLSKHKVPNLLNETFSMKIHAEKIRRLYNTN